MIYAASHLEIAELENIRKQFTLLWGKEFVKIASENKDLAVNQRVLFKLSVRVPDPSLCVQYMKEIAKENNINWEDHSTSHEEKPLGINDMMGGGNQFSGQIGGQHTLQQQQMMLQQQQLALQQQLLQQQLQAQMFQQGTGNSNVGDLDPTTYVMDVKKKDKNGPNVKSSGYQINFNPESDPNQTPDFVNQGKKDIFSMQRDILSAEELKEQQLQQRDKLSHDPLEELKRQLEQTNESRPTAPSDNIDPFDSGFGEPDDFDELQKRFEALKKRD